MQCEALTKSGTQCKRKALPGGKLCRQHQKIAEKKAKIECESAIMNLVVASLKDSTELYKQFQDDQSFKLWLKSWIFAEAKELVKEIG